MHLNFGHNNIFTIILKNMKLHCQLLCQKVIFFLYYVRRNMLYKRDMRNNNLHTNKCRTMKPPDFRKYQKKESLNLNCL